MESQKCLEFTVRVLKVLAYTITFVVVLGSGVIAKGTVLFMTSQLKKDKRLAYCNRNLGMYDTNIILLLKKYKSKLFYSLFFNFQVEISNL